MDQKQIQDKLERIQREVNQVIRGKENVVERVLAAIISGGHILMEDIPGVGKTTLATTFAKALSMNYKRVQFTPDVLPSDILGFSMYDAGSRQFVYRPGAVFCNLFLADEINRTSPKTQSALLEVMEENHATVDGVTRPLPNPFVVIATENPLGSSGTQMLPESQLDRFMICMHIGYPDMKYELEIVKGKITTDPLDLVEPVMNGAQLLRLQDEIHKIYIHDAVYQYIGKLVNATRKHSLIELGISPRGTIALARMVQALAYLRGRNYVLPVDVEDVFIDVEAHRIQLNGKARVNRVTAEQILKDILEGTTKPSVVRK